MSNKEAFIKLVEDLLINANVDENDEEFIMAMNYFEGLKGGNPDKLPIEITKNGIKILQFMQKNWEKYNNIFTSKIIADGLFISSRSVSGSMKKLMSEDFVEKLGGSPVSYAITEKGKIKKLKETEDA